MSNVDSQWKNQIRNRPLSMQTAMQATRHKKEGDRNCKVGQKIKHIAVLVYACSCTPKYIGLLSVNKSVSLMLFCTAMMH